jgi:DNA repair exonuclease SbcCD ATPase subunit
MNAASSEIGNMLTELGTATSKQKKTEEELAAAKAELSQINSDLSTSEKNVTKLTQELSNAKDLLSMSTKQLEQDTMRMQSLEKQAKEGAAWENRYKVAEQERVNLSQQLQALRSALKVLTMTETSTPVQPTPAVATVTPVTTENQQKPATQPKPVIAEVISNEIVPASPVIKPASPELPPQTQSVFSFTA